MNTNNTKEKIINASIQKIRTEDIQNFSIRSLVQTLNLTTGAFYKHFKSKEDLFLTVAQQVSRLIYEQISPKVVEQEDDPQHALCLLGSSLIDFFVEEPKLVDFLFFNPEVLSTYSIYEDRQSSFKLLQLTMDLIDRLIVQDKLKISDKMLFIQTWSFIQGYATLIKNQVVVKEEALIEKTLAEFVKGVSHE